MYSKQASLSLDGCARQAGSASTSSADRPSDNAANANTIVKRTRHAKPPSSDHAAGVLADTDASDKPMRGRGQGRLRIHAARREHLVESDSSDHPAEESGSAGSEPDADSSDESMSGRRRGGRRSRGRRRATSPSMRDDEAADSHVAPRGRGRGGRGRGRPRGSRGRGRGGHIRVAMHDLPRNFDADRCSGLLAADIDPFITELARLQLGAAALQAQVDALGTSAADAVERAELLALISWLKRTDSQISDASARHSPDPQCATDANARAACEVCTELSTLRAIQLAPQVYDGFEKDPNTALLLLMHNTNLRACPALDRLRQVTVEDRGAARPEDFERVLDSCKIQVAEVVASIMKARPSQLRECYDARDPRALSTAVQHAAYDPSPNRPFHIAVSPSRSSCVFSSTIL